MWLASPAVNANSDNANFGPGFVYGGGVGAGGIFFGSDGGWGAGSFGVRPVASIHCGYMLIYHIRDNIETNRSPLTYNVINKNR